MNSAIKKLFVLISTILLFLVLFTWLNTRRALIIQREKTLRSSAYRNINQMKITPVKTVKPGNKWIVVTSINYPTEDVKRLASFDDWNLVVVADTKTPHDWNLENAHFLSVEYQKTLPFTLATSLLYKSYTRKNIGYLYAISLGAEWIYDTDDDNKPYDKSPNIEGGWFGLRLGLNQFDFDDTVSGVRYRPQNGNLTELRQRLFNPYQFYGMDEMWPRGFPLEHFEKHTNGNETQVLCFKMERAAVQQGLVHHDPDVDAIYRLLHADPKSGLDIKFNKFAPPITLSVGTYSPWNSQNTLFHKSAFHTLFLPTTVSFRTTDIWRSFISQKILHLSGLTVSFVPTNAVQFRNAHDYLKDFNDEKQVYDDSGKMIEFLHNWKCSVNNDLKECMNQLADDLVKQKFWGSQDAKLMGMFLKDLEGIDFKFPALIGDNFEDPYYPSTNENTKDVNCRRMNLEFELVDPKQNDKQNVEKAIQKLNYFGDIVEWCNETGYSNLSRTFPSPEQLSKQHESSYVLQKDLDSVLIVVNNYPWNYGMGLIQRLYQPYFASVIFCGSLYSENIPTQDNFTPIINPFNYIHMNPTEIHKGYFSYHCLTLVKEMRLNNVQGYFLMADDAVFNIWQQIDYSRVHHLSGVYREKNPWWTMDNGEYGEKAAARIVESVKKTTDSKVIKAWEKFDKGLKTYGYYQMYDDAEAQILNSTGKSISDFFYIPTSESDYYAVLMRLFYESGLFLEIAVNRFLRSVNHQTSLHGTSSYLWQNREEWSTIYSRNMVAMHPVKLSQFKIPGEARKKYCASIIQTWSDIIFGGSQNFTTKSDDEVDYVNGWLIRE